MRAAELIVVGVDGSDASTAALRWACGEAISTGAVIEAVHAYPPTVGPAPAADDPRAQSSGLLSREVWVALAAIKDSPSIRLRNQPGDTASVLVSRSARAGLLVLGATEHGAGGTTKAGSIASICRQDARCPVAVISRFQQPRGRIDAQPLAAPQLLGPGCPGFAPPASSLIGGRSRRPPEVVTRRYLQPVRIRSTRQPTFRLPTLENASP